MTNRALIQQTTLHWFDIVVVVVFMGLSVVVGLYQWWRSKRAVSRNPENSNAETQEYLMGGRQMPMLPIMMSVLATFLSGLTLLGAPADIYERGYHYFWWYWCVIITLPVSATFFVPVFYQLQLTSSYEYFELRFDSRFLRQATSALFILSTLVYMGVVIYAPAVALATVTGYPLWSIVVGCGVICTIYTAMGGLKAVVWTDTIQAIFMYAGLATLFIKGIIDAGGLERVWHVNVNSGRAETLFTLSVDPLQYNTTWIAFFGGVIYWLSTYSTNQMAVQRYLSVPTLNKARTVIWLTLPAFLVMGTLALCLGPIALAYFDSCDLIGTKQIKHRDQYVIVFALSVFESVPGLFGLFIATLLSGTLSTVSSGLNGMAATLWCDFINQWLHLSDHRATLLNKFIVVVTGVIGTSIALACQALGGIIKVIMLFLGVFTAPQCGIFILGIMVPMASRRGTIIALCYAVVFNMMLAFGNFYYKPHAGGVMDSGPDCPITNQTLNAIAGVPKNESDGPYIFPLFKISQFLYFIIAAINVLVVGVVASWLLPDENVGSQRNLTYWTLDVNRKGTDDEHNNGCKNETVTMPSGTKRSKQTDRVTSF